MSTSSSPEMSTSSSREMSDFSLKLLYRVNCNPGSFSDLQYYRVFLPLLSSENCEQFKSLTQSLQNSRIQKRMDSGPFSFYLYWNHTATRTVERHSGPEFPDISETFKSDRQKHEMVYEMLFLAIFANINQEKFQGYQKNQSVGHSG